MQHEANVVLSSKHSGPSVAHGKLRKSKGTIESDDVIGIVGHPAQQLDAFNEQEIQLGKMQTDSNFKDEVEQALKEEDARRASSDVVS
jgi:hypothetical protein